MTRIQQQLWTPEEEATLAQHYAAGTHAAEIARLLDRNVSQVRNKIDKMALPQIKRGTIPASKDPVELAQERRDRLRELREERVALDAVAGERSLRTMLDTLFRGIVPAVAPPPRYKPGRAVTGEVGETVLFQWSDWHYGEGVDRERVRGFNAYDSTIATARVRSVVSNGRSILDRMRRGGYRFERGVIAVNGDLVTGTIHDLEKHTTEGKVITQSVAECGYLLAESLRDLAADFPRLDVFCTVGNHGRLPDARRMEQKAPLRNWDALVYLFAQCALRECPNIQLTIPNSYAVGYAIDGWHFLQTHGHEVKSWNGIPWYGMQRYTSRITALEAGANRSVHYYLMGHFHQHTSMPHATGETFINGSLIGATEYGVNALGVADRPAQWMMGVHPEHGATHRWPVFPDRDTP